MTSFIQSLQRTTITDNVSTKSAAIPRQISCADDPLYRMANFLSRVAQCLVSHASALPLPIPKARYCISISVRLLSVRGSLFLNKDPWWLFFVIGWVSILHSTWQSYIPPSSSKLTKLQQPDGPSHWISLRLRLCCFWRRDWHGHFACRI
jgi:hypothetical protein